MDDPRDYIIENETGRTKKDHFRGVDFSTWTWWQWLLFLATMALYIATVIFVIGWAVDWVFTALGWQSEPPKSDFPVPPMPLN